MANDDRSNSMQINAGLLYQAAPPTPMPMITPGDMSINLTNQATQNMVQTQQFKQSNAMSAVGLQFRQQFDAIQAQQSMNPYVAQAMSQSTLGGGYAPGMLPSPITMTPASSGIFRPFAPPPMMPIPPTWHHPLVNIAPFTPQLPPPMFQTFAEQQARTDQVHRNEMYSYAAQTPNVLGQGLGYLGGAAMGARIGASFGTWGTAIGAAAGMFGANVSGFAGGLGSLGDLAMRPSVQRHQMGAAIQNMSIGWVVGGPQYNSIMGGLSRDAGIQMGGNIQDMAANKSFRQSTGDMFNQQDLMQIMKGAGSQGLMDMQQSVPQITQQLKVVAQTVSQFMKLTNDPDVTSVIRQMGQLQQFGLSPREMEQAAFNMKRFSKAAGTTIEGLQQIGGLPGAMTFQQAGMTAGAGFQYGNAAAASARQLVASGSIDPRQLSLLGGVQGIAQRDMQAQAAFAAMPLNTASFASYGPNGWGVDQNRLGQVGQGGAFGMVQNAVNGMGSAMQQGGIGALVSYPLQQRMLREKALASMTPAEQEAQRFQIAMRTGEQMGFSGQAAFDFGVQVFNPEVAEQMSVQARSPGYWKAKQQRARDALREEEINQTKAAMEGGSGAWMRGIKRAYAGSGLQGAVGGLGQASELAGDKFTTFSENVADSWHEMFGDDYEETGTIRTRKTGTSAAVLSGLKGRQGAAAKKRISSGTGSMGAGYRGGAIDDYRVGEVFNAMNEQSEGLLGVAAWGLGIVDPLGIMPIKPLMGSVIKDRVQARGEDASLRDAMSDYRGRQSQFAAIDRRGTEISQNKAEMIRIESTLRGKLVGTGTTVTTDEFMRTLKKNTLTMLRNKASGGLTDSVRAPGEGDWNDVISQTEKDSGIKAGGLNFSSSEMADMRAAAKEAAETSENGSRNLQKIGSQGASGERERLDDAMARKRGKAEEDLNIYESNQNKDWGIGRKNWAGMVSKKELAAMAAVGGWEEYIETSIGAGVNLQGDEADKTDAKKMEAEYKAAFLKARGGKWTDALSKEYDARIRAGTARAKKGAGGMTTEEWSKSLNKGIRGKGLDYQTRKDIMTTHTDRAMEEAYEDKEFLNTLPQEVRDRVVAGLEGDGVYTTEKYVKDWTPADIEKLEKSKSPADRNKAATLRKAKTGTDAERAGAIAELENSVAASGKADRVQEATTRTARGPRADKLRKDVTSAEDLGAVFKDFAPAVKDFAEASSNFLTAMQSDTMRRLQGE